MNEVVSEVVTAQANTGLTTGAYISIGIAVVAVVVYLAKWWIGKSLDARFAKLQRLEEEREQERIKEQKMILKGLRILSECDYELIYALKNGTHNGGIDSCMDNVTEYGAEVNDWILQRAAKYGR